MGLAKGAGLGGLAGALSNPYVLAGAAITAATVLVVKSAADFQQQLTRLYTTAGETVPLKTLENAILAIGDATGTSSTDLTNGLYMISSAGYTTAGGLTILKAAAEGAKAEMADLGTVSNALTTVMVDYHAPASAAVSTMDQMITAVSRGKTTLQDFSGSLSTVLPLAAKVGISFADIAGAEATLTAEGVTANQASQDLYASIQVNNCTDRPANYGYSANGLKRR